MKKFLIYAHGGAYNHGAEAIVQMTVAMIRKKYSDAWIGISSNFPEQDIEFGIQADEFFAPDYDIWQKEKQATLHEEKIELAEQMYAKALSCITADIVLISVGGDNYCYGNWHRMEVFQKQAQKCGAKSILWGASIDPEYITSEMIDVLNTYTCILVRESVTFKALQEKAIQVPIKLIPDIAFSLPQRSKMELPSKQYVGINISPLVVRKEIESDIINKNLLRLIKRVVKHGFSIVMIPHVTMPVDNDIEALKDIYKTLPESVKDNVFLIQENLSAQEYKSIIAQCRFVVCSRTHVSIAAYSLSIPTLVIGYSIKSIGIAKDLNMSETVIAIENVDKEEILENVFFEILYTREEMYKKLLDEKVKEYQMQIENYMQYV